MSVNQLNKEKSPYLLQHAHNPVNWYPWGNEAFEKAKAENKPVLVSIGYATCHWCHVMAEETFEDEEMAEIINDRFVAIKVDREERPDIDAIYMKVCQALTGQGGWPLNVFLTPEQQPFYAGMYFPRESRFGMPGFADVITQLYDQYKENPEKIMQIGEQITRAFQKERRKQNNLDEEILHQCYHQLQQSFDTKNGGFGNAPKFPAPHQLTFLLRYYHWTGSDEAFEMVTKTLDGMASGGIYDHIGYGFYRYAVDEQWQIPHFEKMLYDEAMLATAYIEGYQVAGYERYKKTAEEILSYVTGVLQSPEGAFYSAEDADSEGEEGKFYLWDRQEVLDVLGEGLGEKFCEAFDITEAGNFEGKNLPHLLDTNQTKANHEQLEEARRRLFKSREERVHPYKDDKVLTSWNGLMISAFAIAGRVFHIPSYTKIAEDAFQFIDKHLVKDGRLMSRYRDGEVKHKGFIDDYANLLWASIELYETTQNTRYLKKADRLAESMKALFWDQDHGGFYFYGEDSEELILRPKELYDAAIPSGNSIAALQLLRLSKLTGNITHEKTVDEMFAVFAEEAQYHPNGYTFFLQSLMMTKMVTKEVVVLGKAEKRYPLIETLQAAFLPEVTYMGALNANKLEDVASFTKNFKAIDETTTIYVCENFSCRQPTTNIEDVYRQLGIKNHYIS